jgi:hypothetical protein
MGAIANLLVLVVSFDLESQLARIHLDQLGVHRPNELFDRGQIHNQIIAAVHSQCRSRVNNGPDNPAAQLPLYPDSDQTADIAACPKSAKSGNGDVYSITSSARASNVGGMANRQAFAVLRFTTNSNRAGRSIGISVGRAPLNILST